ncbi:relaxin-3-like [Gouania willdenowi]|uniref:Relaxin-3-like n=1 Tax=Gouania willdenowi TaxID=441366 RepID=A0A8C5NFC3_GOUWI|nr:relaxin-3-like [Gouania willdenowi]XP_028329282.1 relaxin-3-like [Gouania willdenowi]
MSSKLLLVTLLCVLYTLQVQTQDNPLRLCGRSFLRAVVFTCGGSRWRRLMGEEEPLPDAYRESDLLKMTAVPVLSRQWRDQNQALMSECCHQGCRRSDLGMLC